MLPVLLVLALAGAVPGAEGGPAVDTGPIAGAPPAPPPPPPESPGNPATATWVPGSWDWSGTQYVWRPGAWRISTPPAASTPSTTASSPSPSTGPAWVSGQWVKDANGNWTWIAGHYEQAGQPAAPVVVQQAPPPTVVVQQPVTRTVYVEPEPTVVVGSYWGPSYGYGYYGSSCYPRSYVGVHANHGWGGVQLHVGFPAVPVPVPVPGFGWGFHHR
jgi:hypothetical protein